MTTPEQTLTSPLDKVIHEISTAMLEWSEEQTAVIAKNVHKRLDQHRDEVLMKLMGFNKNSWGGGWEIDHCNGRNGNSVISDFLKESQAAAVKDWVSQIQMPAMTVAFKNKIAKEMQRHYEREIETSAYSVAKQKATDDLNAFLASVLSPTLVDKHLQMQALLTPTKGN